VRPQIQALLWSSFREWIIVQTGAHAVPRGGVENSINALLFMRRNTLDLITPTVNWFGHLCPLRFVYAGLSAYSTGLKGDRYQLIRASMSIVKP